MTEENKDKLKRKNIRYKPEELASYAKLDSRSGIEKENFEADFHGLVISESHNGCGIVLRKTDIFQVGSHCLAVIDTLPPILSVVVWRTDSDMDIIKIGLKFLE